MNIKDWLYLYNLEEHFALQELMQRQQDLPLSGTTMIFASTANGVDSLRFRVLKAKALKLPPVVLVTPESASAIEYVET